MATISLIGDISQTIYPPDDRFNLLFQGPGGPTKGKYGASCWWLPLGRVGLKIYNKGGFTNHITAQIAADTRRDKWNAFEGKVARARVYLPKVIGWLVVHHVGAYEKGGSVRETGEDMDTFYPAALMRAYRMPDGVEDWALDAMQAAFKHDGIELHWDTYREAQIGTLNGGYVVLDFQDTEHRKYL